MLALVHAVGGGECPCPSCGLGDDVVTSPRGWKHCGRCNRAWEPPPPPSLKAVEPLRVVGD